MESPTILRALAVDLRALELTPAARAPLDSETAPGTYLAVSDVRDAIARLVAVLEDD